MKEILLQRKPFKKSVDYNLTKKWWRCGDDGANSDENDDIWTDLVEDIAYKF